MPGLEDRGQALEWVLGKIAAASKKAPAKPAYSIPKFEPSKPASFQPAAPLGAERKQKEVDLWHQWNNNGRKPKDLDPLLKSFSNVIQKRMNSFRGAEVPKSAIQHKLKTFAVEAFKTWDPKKGGALNTWVTIKLKPGERYVNSNKNQTYSPENITQHIGSYNTLKSELHEKLGYEPDAHYIHDHLLEFGHPKETFAALSLKDIKRLEKEQRRSLVASSHDSEEITGVPNMSSRAEEVKHLIIPELTHEERAVHEFSFGLNGKAQLKPGEIAKKLKMDNSKVSKLRSSILRKMQKHMGGEDE
jgi:DNA-directed RNA polymerase specialized sigma subunit